MELGILDPRTARDSQVFAEPRDGRLTAEANREFELPPHLTGRGEEAGGGGAGGGAYGGREEEATKPKKLETKEQIEGRAGSETKKKKRATNYSS